MVVGVSTTILNFAVYAVLVLLGVQYLAAALVAFMIATANSYTFNRRWTFQAGAHTGSRLSKFVVIQLIGLGVNLLMLTLLVEHGGLSDHKLLAQLIANAFVVVSNFLGNKFYTFRRPVERLPAT